MSKFLKEIYKFLSFKEKFFFFALQILVIFAALLESTSLFSVGFFFSSLMIENFRLPEFIENLFELSTYNKKQLINFIGILTIISFSSTIIISFLNNFFLVVFSENLSKKLKNRFFSYYLDQNIFFHTKNSSNKLIKNLIFDLDRISNGLVLPFLKINSKLVVLFVILISLFILKPVITIAVALLFFLIYFIVIYSLRKFLSYFGRLISLINEQRVQIIQESLSGIKDVLLAKTKLYFLKPFENLNFNYFKFNILYTSASIFPRTVIDLLSFVSLIIIILYFQSKSLSSIDNILNNLILIGFAAYRILPILQDIYNSLLRIKGNKYVVEILKYDLEEINKIYISKNIYSNVNINKFIYINKINFKYNKKDEFNLKITDIKIDIGKSTAIVGKSGSGKSTLIELILGLNINNNSVIYYDNKKLTKKYFNKNRFNISYVSQKPFVLNDNIISNILMTDVNNIDLKKIKKDKFLNDLIKNLDLNFLLDKSGKLNIDKSFGEEGNMISGGQKQRVAIAREIYKKKSILVLDEATSSLDLQTEKRVLNYINKLNLFKTIIYVTHKVQNTKSFDQILFIDDGRLIEKGSYNNLYKNNKNFRKLIE